MKCFLTSSLLIPNTEEINPANGFLDALKHCVPNPCKAVFVCYDPVHHEKTERFAKSIQAAFLSAGFDFSQFTILDSKNQEDAADLVSGADLIILAGGHVPTQNRTVPEKSRLLKTGCWFCAAFLPCVSLSL